MLKEILRGPSNYRKVSINNLQCKLKRKSPTVFFLLSYVYFAVNVLQLAKINEKYCIHLRL